MKIGLTEKQYERILSHVSENQEVKEDEEVPSAEPESGTNAQQSGGQGYPEVGKWESGVTRGPANQVGVTKWSDVVGSTLKRGKANQLKEQSVIGAPNNGSTPTQNTDYPSDWKKGDYSLWSGTPFKKYQTTWGEEIKVPSDGTVNVILWKKDDDRLKIFSSNPNYKQDGKWYIKYENGTTKETRKPTEEWMELILPTDTIRMLYDVNQKNWYTSRIVLEGKANMWNVSPGYFDKNNQPYEWDNYVTRGIVQWWSDNWEMVLTITASAVAGILTGTASLWIQASAQAIAGVGAATFAYLITDPKDRDNVGYAINVILSFIPYMSAGLKIGVRAPLAGLPKIAKYLNKATTMEEVEAAIKLLSKEEQILATRAISQVPKEFNREFKTKMMEGFVKGVHNGEIKLSKIPFAERMWWKQMAAETGVQWTLGSLLNMESVRTWIQKKYDEVVKTKKELDLIKQKNDEEKKKQEKTDFLENKLSIIQDRLNSIPEKDFNEKIVPATSEYSNLQDGNEDDHLKWLEILETALNEYNKNRDADLEMIIKTKYGKNGK